MRFQRFLDSIDPTERNTIIAQLEDLAQESSIAEQMRDNLFAETRLRRDDWQALVTALLGTRTGRRRMQRVIRDFCRDNRQLKGGSASLLPGVVLGRAVGHERFCRMLVSLGYHADIDEAKAALRSILGLPRSKIPRFWQGRDMGRCVMWATFDQLEIQDPFGLPPPRSDIIICSLGMRPVRGPVLLLQYRLPGRMKPKIPTFCDAYAGTSWPRYFQPAGPGASWGETVPTDPCPMRARRPEVVHSVIQLRALVKPMEYAS